MRLVGTPEPAKTLTARTDFRVLARYDVSREDDISHHVWRDLQAVSGNLPTEDESSTARAAWLDAKKV